MKERMTKAIAAKLLDPIHNSIKRNLEKGEAIEDFELHLDEDTATAFLWAFQALIHWQKEEVDGKVRNERLEATEDKRHHSNPDEYTS